MSIQPGVGYTFNASSQGTNLNIERPWAPWAIVSQIDDVCTPYKVKNVTTVTPEGEGAFVTYQICVGTFNNLIPQVFNETNEEFEYLDDLTEGAQLILDFNSTTSSLVYLRVGRDASTNQYPPSTPIGTADPDDPYPRIYNTGGVLPDDDDDFGYLAIAKVTDLGSGSYKVDQYITGSLWADRIKIAGDTATYFYARL
jgi:hypothetical protein